MFHLSQSFEKTKGGKRRKPLNITFCLQCQLLTAFGKRGAGRLVVQGEKSQLLSCQPHTATQAKKKKVKLFLSGAEEDFRGQFGSQLWRIFWKESMKPPLVLTSAPSASKARLSPLPTQWGIRHSSTPSLGPLQPP